MDKPIYRRILLKLSGEALADVTSRTGLCHEACLSIASSIVEMHRAGVEVGVVVGGGNIFRGKQADLFGFEKTAADHIGMLATAINGLTLSQVVQSKGIKARVMSAFPLGNLAEVYSWKGASEALDRGEVVFFVGGTGNPYFSTDTAASLRAAEMGCQLVLKATKVDGVYDKDPNKYSDAKIYKRLDYEQVLSERLQVMDATAIALCRENEIPIQVVNLFSKESLVGALYDDSIGTMVASGNRD